MSKASSIKTPELKKTIKKLNALGIIQNKPGDELSRFQIYRIKKKEKEYNELLKHPERFAVRTVSKETAKTMKKAGVKVSKSNKAIIALKGFDTVTINGSNLVFQGKNKKTGAKVKEKVTLIGSENFESRIKALSKQKLKKNQTLSIKIGDSATSNTTFQNVSDLIKYVNKIKFNVKRGQSNSDVLRQVSIVEITETGKRNNAAKKKPKK